MIVVGNHSTSQSYFHDATLKDMLKPVFLKDLIGVLIVLATCGAGIPLLLWGSWMTRSRVQDFKRTFRFVAEK